MHFFQNQEAPVINFRCLHLTHLQHSKSTLLGRVSKRPFERYKDMKQAIKLIEKDEEFTGKSIDQDFPSLQSSPNTSFLASTHPTKKFPSRRLRVTHKKANPDRYRELFMRSITIDRLIKLR